MTIRRHVRSWLLVCICASLVALQLSAGTPQLQPSKLAVGAVHQTAVRHISDRRLVAKRLVASLPVSAMSEVRPCFAGDVAPLGEAAILVRHAGTCPARAPPLS